MNTKILFLIIIALVLAFGSALFWLVLSQDSNVPAGWTKYQNQEIGFQLYHPQEVRVGVPYEQTVILGTVTEEADFEDFEDEGFPGIQFLVSRQSTQGRTLEEVVQERSASAEQTMLVGFPAYQYVSVPQDFETPPFSVIVFSPEPNQLLQISYSVYDPDNHGYEQILQQMVDSFKLTQPGGVSPLAIVMGILIVIGILIGIGLLFVSRP